MSKERKAFLTRLDAPEQARINQWRGKQPEIPSISDALRFLLKIGLAATEDDKAKVA